MSRWSLSIALAQYLPLCTEEGGLLVVLGEGSRYKVPLGPSTSDMQGESGSHTSLNFIIFTNETS